MKIGVLGCGYWGPNLVRNLVELNRASRIYCYDEDPRRLAALYRRYPCVSTAASADELIERSDAVMVATPVTTHYSLVREILMRGKAVFVEKPLATSSDNAADLIQLAWANDLVLMVGHTFIYSPPVRKVREYIENGTLGKLYFLSSERVNLGIHRNDVDVLWDLAPHDISIFLYWLGEMPSRAAAVGRACVGSMMDVASIHFEFPSGVLANIEISWLAPSKLRRTVIVGDQKMIIYDDTESIEKIRLCDHGILLRTPETFGEFQLTYRTGDIISPKIDSTEPLLIQVSHFLDCVEKHCDPKTDGLAGLEVVLAIEAASKSIKNEGKFVRVATPATVSSRFSHNPVYMDARVSQNEPPC